MNTIADSFLRARPVPAKSDRMPILTAAASVPVVASMMLTAVFGVVVAGPQTSDLYSVLGAGIVAVCSLIEAQGAGRPTADKLRSFIGSSGFGSMGPGLVYLLFSWFGWITPERAQYLGWQVWAAAGAFFAANGWAMAHSLNKRLMHRSERMFDRWLGRVEGTVTDEPPKPTKSKM